MITPGVFIAVGALLVWTIAAYIYLPYRPNFKGWRPQSFVFTLALLLTFVGVGIRFLYPRSDEITTWWLVLLFDLAPNMVTAGFTVLVIERLTRWWIGEQEQEKEKLNTIAMLRSNDLGVVSGALTKVKNEQWHKDGSLENFLGPLNIQGNRLIFAKMNGAQLSDSNLVEAKLPLAKLRGAILDRARLQGAHLQDADLQNSSLKEVRMNTETILRGANFQGASFRRAKLGGVLFNDCIICGADFVFSSLTNDNINGAKYDELTKFPGRIDPQAAGAIKGVWDKQREEFVPDPDIILNSE